MIYLIYGNNRDKILKRSNEILNTFKDKAEHLVLKIDTEEFDSARLEELAQGRSLFSKKIVILCDGLLANKGASSFVFEKMNEIAASNNVFIFREEGLNKKASDSFSKGGAKLEELNERKPPSGYKGAWEVKLKAGYESFNIFNFSDEIGRRDKKAAWVQYHKALRAGFPVEELFWKAVWIFRNIILASPLNSDHKGVASTLKISPFVFNKAKGFAVKYDIGQLTAKYKELTDIYHQMRRGIVDMDMAMERFILNL